MSLREAKGEGERTDKGDKNSSAEERSGRKRKGGGLKARMEKLEDALEKVSSEAAENYDKWLRARAEYENLKKRTSREIEQVHQSAGRNLVASILPVLDDLEKAIEVSRESAALRAMEKGLSLIHQGLLDALRGGGVQVLNPEGERFDPNVHEAIMQTPSADAEPGSVVQVLQNGYLMNGITLRAAKVVVAGDPEPAPGESLAPDGDAPSGEEASSGEEVSAGDDTSGPND